MDCDSGKTGKDDGSCSYDYGGGGGGDSSNSNSFNSSNELYSTLR
jgi:hypothetical protein